MAQEQQSALGKCLAQARSSFLLVYQTAVFNTLSLLVTVLNLGDSVFRLGNWLRGVIAWLGGPYTTEKVQPGTRIPYSLVGYTDSDFSTPHYDSRDFPFGDQRQQLEVVPLGKVPSVRIIDHPANAHFMLQCAKLAYEDSLVIQDVVTGQWGLDWVGCADQPKTATGEEVDTPGAIYFACFASERAVIVTFRGTVPTDLLNWGTDIGITFQEIDGIGGVHKGFYSALFEKASGKKESLFDALVRQLKGALNGRNTKIFITGHSLGGALASVCAQGLAAHQPDLAKLVDGVFTFGQPRVGNSTYVEQFYSHFAGRVYRCVHATDLVPRVPAGLGYAHHPSERYLTSFYVASSRVLRGEYQSDEIEGWKNAEYTWAPLVNLYKLLIGPVRENCLRWLARLLLLPLPGLNDHFPDGYARALKVHLDDFVRKQQAPPQPQQANGVKPKRVQ